MAEETPQVEAPTSGVFDVDKAKAGYEPLTVRFRGVDYVLGAKAAHVLGAVALRESISDPDEGESDNAYAARLAGVLPDLLVALCPGFPVDDLNAEDEVLLMQAAMEAVARVGSMNFSATGY